MKNSGSSQRLEVRAFLILERVTDSKAFGVSVLFQAEGRAFAKTSLGTVAEGQEILLTLHWDQPRQRFVASSEAPGSAPALAFIPFSPAADSRILAEFSTKNCVLNSRVSKNKEVDESKN